MNRVIRENKIINKYRIGSVRMVSVVEKIMENILRFLGHVLMMKETEAVRVIKCIYVKRERGRGRSKNRLKDVIESDMR